MSITDLSHALGRDPAVVSKHAIGTGIPFSARVRRAPRTPRANRPTLSLNDILAPPILATIDHHSGPDRRLLAMPDLPFMPAALLDALHRAGLLDAASETPELLLTRSDASV